MKGKKFISLALSALMTFGLVACGGEEEVTTPTQRVLTSEEIAKIADKIPDYANSGKTFDFFGYSS